MTEKALIKTGNHSENLMSGYPYQGVREEEWKNLHASNLAFHTLQAIIIYNLGFSTLNRDGYKLFFDSFTYFTYIVNNINKE